MFRPLNQKVIKNRKNFIWQTLIIEHCIPLSQPAKLTNKKLTQYLLGSRFSMNIFKFHHIQHLLLRLTPFLSTLFYSQIKLKNKIGRAIYQIPPKPPRDPNKIAIWKERIKKLNPKRFKRKKHYYKTFEKKKPIKILFATTNPAYSEIIKSAADLCNMPFHTERWLCGSLTANAKYILENYNSSVSNTTILEKIHDNSISNLHYHYDQAFRNNKYFSEKQYTLIEVQKKSNKPSLIILPDLHNNEMILRESIPLHIPVIGLINSDSGTQITQITYPIFGNANSIHIVHFFCHFLAALIGKEFIKKAYKNKYQRLFKRSRHLNAYVAERKKQYKITKSPTQYYQNFQQKKYNLNKLFKSQQPKYSILIKHYFKKQQVWQKIRKKMKLKLLKLQPNIRSRKKVQKLFLQIKRRMLGLKLMQSRFIRLKKKESREEIKGKNIRQKFKSRWLYIRRYRRGILPRVNKVLGNRFFSYKEKNYFTESKNYFSDFTYPPTQESSLALFFKLLFVLKHKNARKKVINKFFTLNPALSYLTHIGYQKYSKTLYKDTPKIFFFERYLNKMHQKLFFSSSLLKKENIITNESIWRNAYWTYFKNQKKKKKLRAHIWKRARNPWSWRKRKALKRKFRRKISLRRTNIPYNFQTTRTLINMSQTQRWTRLWFKTRKRIYRDLRTELWTKIAKYWNRKKRKFHWSAHWFHREVITIKKHVKFKYKKHWKTHSKDWKRKSNKQSIIEKNIRKAKNQKQI